MTASRMSSPRPDADVIRVDHDRPGQGAGRQQAPLLASEGCQRRDQGAVVATIKFRAPSLTPAPTSDGGSSSGGGGASDQLNLSQVTWLHTNASGWPKTSTITSASIWNPPICIDHTKRGSWLHVSAGGTTVEGNPWVSAKVNGTWYGATYDWLRPGQECKGISASNIGAHIKISPLKGWTPKSGEQIGLMVSTPARFGTVGPKHERSNVVMVTWP